MIRRIASLLSLTAFLAVSSASAQNVTITPSTISVPVLGVFVGGTTISSYTVDSTSGSITRVGGNAFPSSKAGSINTITVTCTSCNGTVGRRTINMSVTAGAASGRFSITNFTRSNETISPSGTVSGASSGSPLNFAVEFPSGAGTKTISFRLGMSFQLSTTGGTGARTFNYTVVAARVTP